MEIDEQKVKTDDQKVKTKVRFTSLDVSAMVSYMKDNLIGQRVTNIYDVNPTTYLLKMASGENKEYLLIENGVRFHLTNNKSQRSKMPSGFTMKFRKFLRAKRLEKVRQVGLERVVVLTFGSQNFTNHLILELYAQGNIILTDSQYKIIQCIRSHEFTETVKTAVGELYPFQYAAHIYMETLDPSKDNIMSIFKKQEDKDTGEDQKKKSKKKSNQFKLKELLMKVIPCLFPQAAEHIILTDGLNPNQKCTSDNTQNIQKAAASALVFLKQFQEKVHKGYLFSVCKNQKQKYFEYSPFLPKAYENKEVNVMANFSQAVDAYYLDFKKPDNEEDLEGLSWKKYQQIKNDQDSRLQKLINDQEDSQHKASLIQKNIDDVEAIIKIIKTMLDNGLSWTQIQTNINESKKTGNPLAQLILSVNLSKNVVTVMLGDPSAQNQHAELVDVEINVNSNAFTNAKIYYEDRKKNKQKQIRTKEASEQVLKIAEKEALKDIEKKKNQRQQNVVNIRKSYWFQKFYWILTSQGYLVISGRDSHQNELLVKKYMRAGDLYMHSDYGGAASTIIKNPTKEPLVRAALEEAAIFTVCRSKAWETKIISGAWWVNSQQVSKSAPTGQFLPTGSFMIRGKKNFVYPNKMEMGMTLLYRLDLQSALKHEQNKKPQQEKKVESYQLQIQKAHQQKLKEEDFTIINLQENKKKKSQQQNQRNNKVIAKKIQKSKEQEVKEQNDDDQSDQELDQVELKKAPSKQDKQNPGKDNNNTQQPSQYKNKKRMKKLEKHLEEQDEEERQIIMKMLGAKEMKHRRNQQEEEEEREREKEKNKNKKLQGKDKKRDKDKFNLEDKEDEKKIDKEKIPFLMKDEEMPARKTAQERQKQKQDLKDQTNQDKKQLPKPQPQTQVQVQQPQQSTHDQVGTTDNKQSQNVDQQLGEEGVENEVEQKDSDGEEDAEQEKQPDNYEQDEKVLDSDMNDLTRLSGTIRMEDNYDTLIAMCAPYATIAQNRFKIKLTPGGVKKGKAARNILNYFTTTEVTDKEKQILKGIPQQQVINCLVSGVKLGAAGLLKIQMKEKAQKKQIRKIKDVQKEKERQKEKEKDKQKKK